MLNYARQRVLEALKIPKRAVMVTSGPAGVQAGEFPCDSAGLSLFLLVPKTSDHLFNLEANPAVIILTGVWELRGEAQPVLPDRIGFDLEMLKESGPYTGWLEWAALVRIDPGQVQIRRGDGWGNLETFDIIFHG